MPALCWLSGSQGWSEPAQLVVRLQQRGLIEVVGTRSGGRGPSAELYAVRPRCSYSVGVDMVLDRIQAAASGVTGPVIAHTSRPTTDKDDPVRAVHEVVEDVLAQANVNLSQLSNVVIGTTGVVDPGTGDVTFSFDLPKWHRGLHDALHEDLGCEITIENDVNLAAIAEREEGAARDVQDMVLFWVGRGTGLAVVLGGLLAWASLTRDGDDAMTASGSVQNSSMRSNESQTGGSTWPFLMFRTSSIRMAVNI